MNKLLAANFMRLKKSFLFWGCIVFMAGFALLLQIFNYFEIQEFNAQKVDYDLAGVFGSDAMVFATFVGIVSAVFISLFTGTEYSDGTIRNKVVIGHRRRDIYFSNLITGIFTGICVDLAYLAVYFVTGPVFIGDCFGFSVSALLVQLLTVVVLTAALGSVFTLISMLNHNKAASAVVCVLLAFALLFAGSYTNSRLSEPEYLPEYYVDENGAVQQGEPEKNPRYLTGTKRQVYQFANDFLPGGQQIQLAGGGTPKPWTLMGYSGVIVLISTVGGVAAFRRKDLR